MQASSSRIIHFLPNLCVGGAETFLLRLVPLLPANQTLVLFWGTKNMPASRVRLISRSCNVICIDPFNTSLSSILAFLRLIISLDNEDHVFSWLHMSDFFASIIKLLHPSNFKLFWNIRNIPIEPSQYSKVSYACFLICVFLLRRVPDKIIFNSFTAKKLFLSKGLPVSKCKVIHNGFDISPLPFHSRTIGNPFVIVCCARFHPQKNHSLLLKSFSLFNQKYPNSKLSLIGPGCDASNIYLKHLIDEFQINTSVLLHSVLPYNESLSIMKTSHVSILLSSFGESFPNVIAESIICGCYPVATDVGDSSMIVGCIGKIFPVNPSPLDICSFLIDLYHKFIESPLEWNSERKVYAATVSNKFSLHHAAQQYANLL